MNDDEPVGIENIAVGVKDINAMQRRYNKLQARIDAAEILGMGTIEYEKESSRSVRLGRGAILGGGYPPIYLTIPQTTEQKLSNANILFDMQIDLWQKKGEE